MPPSENRHEARGDSYVDADEALREFSDGAATVEIPFETMQELVYPQGVG